MNRRGFFRSLLGLGAVVAGAPLLPKVVEPAATLAPSCWSYADGYNVVTTTTTTDFVAGDIVWISGNIGGSFRPAREIHEKFHLTNLHTFDGRIS